MKVLNPTKVATAIALLASALLSVSASASDQKINHAMACVPLSPQTSYSDLYYRPAGLKNVTDANQYVVCPLQVDADSVNNWTATGAQTASFYVTIHTPEAGMASCEVSVGSNLDGTKATFSGSRNGAAGTTGNVVISGIHGDDVSQDFLFNYPVSLYCKIPPNSTILRLRLLENNIDTDDTLL